MTNGVWAQGLAKPPQELLPKHDDQVQLVDAHMDVREPVEDREQQFQRVLEALMLLQEPSEDYFSRPISDHSSAQRWRASFEYMIRGWMEQSTFILRGVPPQKRLQGPKNYSCIRSTGTSESSRTIQDRSEVQQTEANASVLSGPERFKQAIRAYVEQQVGLEELISSPQRQPTRQDRRLWQRNSEPWLYCPGVYVTKLDYGEAVKGTEPILKKE